VSKLNQLALDKYADYQSPPLPKKERAKNEKERAKIVKERAKIEKERAKYEEADYLHGPIAACLSHREDLSRKAQDELEHRAFVEADFKLVYVTPEKMFQAGESGEHGFRRPMLGYLLGLLQQKKLHGIAIDEAHGISSYGKDFRKDFGALGKLRTEPELVAAGIVQVPIIAMTATAQPHTRHEICAELNLREPPAQLLEKVLPIFRPNLHLSVQCSSRAISDRLIEVLKSKMPAETPSGAAGKGKYPPTIVYYNDKEKELKELKEKVEDKLGMAGKEVAYYHSKYADKEASQMNFENGDCRIIIATNAFGMGIDKADVRSVILCGMPQSISEYSQQIGRAGRDGLVSDCIVLSHPNDASTPLG